MKYQSRLEHGLEGMAPHHFVQLPLVNHLRTAHGLDPHSPESLQPENVVARHQSAPFSRAPHRDSPPIKKFHVLREIPPTHPPLSQTQTNKQERGSPPTPLEFDDEESPSVLQSQDSTFPKTAIQNDKVHAKKSVPDSIDPITKRERKSKKRFRYEYEK